jgi:hypothetical protein
MITLQSDISTRLSNCKQYDLSWQSSSVQLIIIVFIAPDSLLLDSNQVTLASIYFAPCHILYLMPAFLMNIERRVSSTCCASLFYRCPNAPPGACQNLSGACQIWGPGINFLGMQGRLQGPTIPVASRIGWRSTTY